MFSGAAAASMFDGDTGYFLQAGWEGRFGGFMISANMARSFGQFTDLAAVTAVGGKGIDSDASVPRALDRLAVSYSLPALQAGVGASFVHREMVDGTRALILSGSYSQTLFEDITVFGTAYGDFGDEEEFGVYVGASFPLGKEMTASASGSFTDKGTSATAEVSRSFDEDDDIPYAWRVAHAEGETRTTAASGAARFNKAALEASMTHQDSSFRADVAVDGSLAMAGGSLIAGRRIDDAFAVVNVGAPDVPVEFENRMRGRPERTAASCSRSSTPMRATRSPSMSPICQSPPTSPKPKSSWFRARCRVSPSISVSRPNSRRRWSNSWTRRASTYRRVRKPSSKEQASPSSSATMARCT